MLFTVGKFLLSNNRKPSTYMGTLMVVLLLCRKDSKDSKEHRERSRRVIQDPLVKRVQRSDRTYTLLKHIQIENFFGEFIKRFHQYGKM